MGMPDNERLRRDRERKRSARQAQRKARRPGNSFAVWFKARVDEMPEDTAAWSVRLSEAMGEGAEYDRHLRKIYDGKNERPRPETVFRIGVGLHHAGVAWCSGPLALYAAGYVVEFYGFLAILAREPSHFIHALTFAYVAPACDETSFEIAGLEGWYRSEQGAKLRARYEARVREARQIFASAADESSADRAWESWKRSRSIRTAPDVFGLAYVVMAKEPPIVSAAVRERSAVALLDAWAREDSADEQIRAIAERLRPFSVAGTAEDNIKMAIFGPHLGKGPTE